jgi:hypothetical protein
MQLWIPRGQWLFKPPCFSYISITLKMSVKGVVILKSRFKRSISGRCHFERTYYCNIIIWQEKTPSLRCLHTYMHSLSLSLSLSKSLSLSSSHSLCLSLNLSLFFSISLYIYLSIYLPFLFICPTTPLSPSYPLCSHFRCHLLLLRRTMW